MAEPKTPVILSVIALLVFSISAVFAQSKDVSKYVDPFIGTGGHGHTFPGATVPFGFVQLSPDTRIDNWDGSSGYHYSDSIIYGFSHNHLSGTGIPDYCDILFMPMIGEPEFSAKDGEKDENGYASKFSHENEKAEPGYYRVILDDGNIFAELTATKRVGFHRYTFPKSEKANIILDLKWRDEVLDSDLTIVGKNRIEGYRRSSSWAKNQVVYFVAEFSKPFIVRSKKIEQIKTISHESNPDRESGSYKTDIKTAFCFKTKKDEQVLLKVAISPVSIEGARKNLEAEIPHWDFEKARTEAKTAWNKELSKIEVSGGTDAQMANFYTSLYHTMIAPNIFQDVDGNYLGLDKKVHNIADGRSPRVSKGAKEPPSENYTIFSLWDTFRAAHPLYTIIDEKRTVDFINTFIRQYEQGGRLPVWELAANETDTMIGYHSVSVIADAMAKGIRGFDYEKAFEAAKHSAELDHFGLEAYKRRGYISMEDEQESVSKTLEYAYNDFCIAVMAKILWEQKEVEWTKNGRTIPRSAVIKGDPKTTKQPTYIPPFRRFESDYNTYSKRSQYYKNLFDKESGFMRPKQNGNWISPFQPNEITFHFTEGNSWQYSFFVPHDVNGLISLYGGKKKFAEKLDGLLTADSTLIGRDQPDITGQIGQYAHGNEPSHHIIYLYNYVDEPWKTQFYTRKIMDEFYTPTPDGLIGNEDCGQMSAWYILSALGFYQVNPSVPMYEIGTPIFPEAKINLENGKTFSVKARNVSAKNIYVKSVTLNGKPHRQSFFTHSDIKNGGELEFEMSDQPIKDWFIESPVSKIELSFPPVPAIEAKRVFENRTMVVISSPEPKAKLFYTLDGTDPNELSSEYLGPLYISETTLIKAVSLNGKVAKSMIAEAKLNKMPNDWDVKLASTYNRQYTGGGPKGLIDGLRGSLNFASGEWQGYQNQDFVAVIDLKRETEIKKLGGSFLQDARPWIWMPTRIEFETSIDGENFSKVAEMTTDVAVEDMKPTIKVYSKGIPAVTARFVRVKAYNLGKIPAWHPGSGFDAFIFVDEIFIN